MKELLDNCEDIIGIIIEYLNIKELLNLCLTIKQFKLLLSIKLKWKEYCFNSWNIQSNLFKINKDFDGLSLYSYTWNICSTFNIPENNNLIQNNLIIQFNGLVGENNRSIRTVQSFLPLNKPLNNFNKLIKFAKYLCGCNKHLIYDEENEKIYFKFFSTPYYDPILKIHRIELRQVAYYEIKITSDSILSLNEEDCIVVGLSKENFSLVNVMPGWDYESYGYHSDDGGIFHGKGTQLRTYGPKFGLDDIVGCGLRYDTNEIFYTLNGTYLGVAFENVSGKLYPTVGIDAQVQIHFNFGAEAFQFSLHHLVKYF